MTLGNQPASVQGLPAVPRPEESDRRRLRLHRAGARRHGRDFAGPAGGRNRGDGGPRKGRSPRGQVARLSSINRVQPNLVRPVHPTLDVD